MLTEGWDANTAKHVLGVKAFGTQLLCEQVIGRALRRQCDLGMIKGLQPAKRGRKATERNPWCPKLGKSLPGNIGAKFVPTREFLRNR